MKFVVSRPIWEQLVAEFSRRIAVGQWRPGERVPSVRTLAVEFGVNPNTVQRALAELDRRGLMVAQGTAGRDVTRDENLITQILNDLAGDLVRGFVSKMRGLGITRERAQQMTDEQWQTEEGKYEPR